MRHHDAQGAVIQMGQAIVARMPLMALMILMARAPGRMMVCVPAMPRVMPVPGLMDHRCCGIGLVPLRVMPMHVMQAHAMPLRIVPVHIIQVRTGGLRRRHDGMGRYGRMFGSPQGTGDRRRKRGEAEDPEGQPDQPAVTVAATVHADGYPVCAARQARKGLEANVP